MARGIYPAARPGRRARRGEQPFVRAALQDTDRRVGEDKPVAPSFLLACVLWSDVRDGWASGWRAACSPFPALQEAIDEVFESRIGDISGRGKLGADMREIWMMQPRFERARAHALQPGGAAALPRRLRLHAPARRRRRGRRGAGRLVAGVQPGERRVRETWWRSCATSSASSRAGAPQAPPTGGGRPAVRDIRPRRAPRPAPAGRGADGGAATRRASAAAAAASRRGRAAAAASAAAGPPAPTRTEGRPVREPVTCLHRPGRQPGRRATALAQALAGIAGIAQTPAAGSRALPQRAGGRRRPRLTSTPWPRCAPRLTAPELLRALQALEQARRPRASLPQRAAHARPGPAAVRRRAHRQRRADRAASAYARAGLRAGAAGGARARARGCARPRA